MRRSGARRIMPPGLYDEIAEIAEPMGPAPRPYGIEPNRATLETFVQDLVDRHFPEAPVPLDDLFAPIVGWAA